MRQIILHKLIWVICSKNKQLVQQHQTISPSRWRLSSKWTRQYCPARMCLSQLFNIIMHCDSHLPAALTTVAVWTWCVCLQFTSLWDLTGGLIWFLINIVSFWKKKTWSNVFNSVLFSYVFIFLPLVSIFPYRLINVLRSTGSGKWHHGICDKWC